MSVTQELQNLISSLSSAITDAERHETGNNAAGGRIRKVLQSTVTTCKDLRKTIQEERNSRKSS
tara:strand:+ start:744 stop:935 length:192 start_codon:yes stop_codon:yes gene_type:complete